MLSQLPPRFAAFTLDSLAQNKVYVYECERMAYHYENIFRIYNLPRPYPPSEGPTCAYFYPLHYEDEARMASMPIQVATGRTIDVYFSPLPYEVEVETEVHNPTRRPGSPDFRRHRDHPSYINERLPCFILATRENLPFTFRNQSHGWSFSAILTGNHQRIANVRHVARDRLENLCHYFHLSVTMDNDRHTAVDDFIHRMEMRQRTRRPPGVYYDEEELRPQTPPRRRPIEAPRPSSRAAPPHDTQPRQAPQEPPERLALAMARDFISQREMCPILQEPLTHGDIAITSCFHVFDSASLTHWTLSQNTHNCPQCRAHMTFRTVHIDAPAEHKPLAVGAGEAAIPSV